MSLGRPDRTWFAALALLGLGACGRPGADFSVHGVGVVVRSDAAFVQTSDFPDRVESTLSVALAYWGGRWEDLQGRTITFDGGAVTCGGVTGAAGCFDGELHVSTSDLGSAFSCVEQTVLVHEVGHAVIGDAAHADARWMDFSEPERQLQGRIGYAPAGEVACPIFVSVWRHPPP
jgi:hypothetical protein